MSLAGPLLDRFGRVHSDLRISVTDRCNLRCRYCMPTHGVAFRTRSEILSFEEIVRFVRVAASLGIRKVRLTGGEPLMRSDLSRLIEMLAGIPGIDDLAMTTNAVLLADHALALQSAGLGRLNVSLDTLDREKFRRLTGRDRLPQVLLGIDAAIDAGFRSIKLNALAIRGTSEEDLVPLTRFVQDRNLELRFIEFMPFDARARWSRHRVLPGDEILRTLARAFGPLVPVAESTSSPAVLAYRFQEAAGSIGVITPVSHPFCSRCCRLRLTAEGQIRNCLFASTEWDARALLRNHAADEDLARLIAEAVWAKEPSQGTSHGRLTRPYRRMHQIGG